jgi:hypothetical protein
LQPQQPQQSDASVVRSAAEVAAARTAAVTQPRTGHLLSTPFSPVLAPSPVPTTSSASSLLSSSAGWLDNVLAHLDALPTRLRLTASLFYRRESQSREHEWMMDTLSSSSTVHPAYSALLSELGLRLQASDDEVLDGSHQENESVVYFENEESELILHVPALMRPDLHRYFL